MWPLPTLGLYLVLNWVSFFCLFMNRMLTLYDVTFTQWQCILLFVIIFRSFSPLYFALILNISFFAIDLLYYVLSLLSVVISVVIPFFEINALHHVRDDGAESPSLSIFHCLFWSHCRCSLWFLPLFVIPQSLNPCAYRMASALSNTSMSPRSGETRIQWQMRREPLCRFLFFFNVFRCSVFLVVVKYTDFYVPSTDCIAITVILWCWSSVHNLSPPLPFSHIVSIFKPVIPSSCFCIHFVCCVPGDPSSSLGSFVCASVCLVPCFKNINLIITPYTVEAFRFVLIDRPLCHRVVPIGILHIVGTIAIRLSRLWLGLSFVVFHVSSSRIQIE